MTKKGVISFKESKESAFKRDLEKIMVVFQINTPERRRWLKERQ
jgi:hypothetical protein